MHTLLRGLLEHLDLERLEINLFRGTSRDIGAPRVFGGQVLGQALMAATRTVEKRIAHSLHAYFLRMGDSDAPIIYDVDRSRDGGSFSARRVVAIQHGRPIFTLAASFQRPEPGLDHQFDMPDVPAPEDLRDALSYVEPHLDRLSERMRRFFRIEKPFEFRPVQDPQLLEPARRPPRKQIWVRAVDRLPDDDALHYCLLAYLSDYELITTATLPHQISHVTREVQLASLDHAMWFHRPPRVDDWLLYDCDSPSASAARAFARGTFYASDGTLVASVAQEGLIRIRDTERRG